MKFRTVIDPSHEEEIVIYAHQKSKLIDEIEKLILQEAVELVGYKDKTAVLLDQAEICCFAVEHNKVYAKTLNGSFALKNRLYQIEEKLPKNFIKINQSCIANINQIKKFDASFAGTLRVVFKNGESDYVSRRNLKGVKERLGL